MRSAVGWRQMCIPGLRRVGCGARRSSEGGGLVRCTEVADDGVKRFLPKVYCQRYTARINFVWYFTQVHKGRTFIPEHHYPGLGTNLPRVLWGGTLYHPYYPQKSPQNRYPGLDTFDPYLTKAYAKFHATFEAWDPAHRTLTLTEYRPLCVVLGCGGEPRNAPLPATASCLFPKHTCVCMGVCVYLPVYVPVCIPEGWGRLPGPAKNKTERLPQRGGHLRAHSAPQSDLLGTNGSPSHLLLRFGDTLASNLRQPLHHLTQPKLVG